MAAATATQTRARAPWAAARVSPVPPCRPPSTRPRPPGSPRHAPVSSRTRPGAYTHTRTHAPGSLARTPRRALRAAAPPLRSTAGMRSPESLREAARALLGNVVPALRSAGRPSVGAPNPAFLLAASGPLAAAARPAPLPAPLSRRPGCSDAERQVPRGRVSAMEPAETEATRRGKQSLTFCCVRAGPAERAAGETGLRSRGAGRVGVGGGGPGGPYPRLRPRNPDRGDQAASR